MTENTLIKLQNIGKIYRTGLVSFEALKNVDLEIARGENAAILGPSGSGKSTLMQIIGCLLTPTSGSYFLDGQDVSHLEINQLAKIRNQKVGFVFQNFNLLPHLNIVDNVALPLLYTGISAEKRRSAARDVLTKLGLDQHFKHRPNELSGGQQQRVAIARALVTEPDLILADEPTGNLDSKSGEEVIKLLDEATQQGRTVITVTHDETLAQHARRIIKIHDGRIRQ